MLCIHIQSLGLPFLGCRLPFTQEVVPSHQSRYSRLCRRSSVRLSRRSPSMKSHLLFQRMSIKEPVLLRSQDAHPLRYNLRPPPGISPSQLKTILQPLIPTLITRHKSRYPNGWRIEIRLRSVRRSHPQPHLLSPNTAGSAPTSTKYLPRHQNLCSFLLLNIKGQ